MDAGDRTSQGPLPVDRALPGLHRLEPVHLARTLARHAAGGTVTDARVRRLDWVPGRRFTALVDALVQPTGAGHGSRREAVVSGGAGRGPVDAVRWLPDDPALPLLRVGWARRAPRIGYRPGRRAVIRMDDRVLTGYASDREFSRAQNGLELLRGALGAAAATPDEALPHVRATAQRAVDGTVPDDPDAAVAVAADAGALLARLHGSRLRAPRRVGAFESVARSEAAVSRVEAALPVEGYRARLLVETLRRCRPADDDLVLSHGGFGAHRLVRSATAASAPVVLLGVDAVALAPRALDLATFPAHLVSGVPQDGVRVEEALDRLLDGYRIVPRYLDWYLATTMLARLDRPLRLLLPRWPDLVGRTVDLVADVAKRCSAAQV